MLRKAPNGCQSLSHPPKTRQRARQPRPPSSIAGTNNARATGSILVFVLTFGFDIVPNAVLRFACGFHCGKYGSNPVTSCCDGNRKHEIVFGMLF
jgi:hypothetical protein